MCEEHFLLFLERWKNQQTRYQRNRRRHLQSDRLPQGQQGSLPWALHCHSNADRCQHILRVSGEDVQ